MEPFLWALAGIAGLILFAYLKGRRARQRFLEKRESLSEDIFFDRVGARSRLDRILWATVRRSQAWQCGVPPEALQPDDLTETLWSMRMDGYDYASWFFEFEQLLPTSLTSNEFETEFTACLSENTGSGKTFQELGNVLVPGLRTFIGRLLERGETLPGEIENAFRDHPST